MYIYLYIYIQFNSIVYFRINPYKKHSYKYVHIYKYERFTGMSV